ncbi:MAG: acyltransferase [Lachnospiraceae bacterium]|nr:acyltransferase [Lachnospiraceae bacterium]
MKRISNLNFIRGISALFVLLFHMHVVLHIHFGGLYFLVVQSASWMTIFFLLSGFVLHYTYREKSLDSREELFTYVKKRFLSLYPLYVLVWIVFYFWAYETDGLKEDLVTFPAQLTMLFGYRNYQWRINSGAWFMGAIILCYLLYPLIRMYVRQLKSREVLALALLMWILNSAAPFVGRYYGFEVYNEATVRAFEFILGVCLSELYLTREKRTQSPLWALLSVLVYLLGMYLIRRYDLFGISGDQCRMNWFTTVSAAFILLSFAECENRTMIRLAESRPIALLSKYSLEIWVASWFSCAVCDLYLWPHPVFNSNGVRLAAAFLVELLFVVLLSLYDHYLKKFLERIGIRYFFLGVCGFFLVSFAVRFIFRI